jgi:predicted CoA-binding protein
MDKHTLVIGVSTHSDRFANKAVRMLKEKGFPVSAFGKSNGMAEGLPIITRFEEVQLPVHTVTMYLNPEKQKEIMESVFSLNPKRIIFNPGTENYKFIEDALSRNIEVLEACTLVLLSIGNF